MRLLIDENIPCAADAFGSLGAVRTMPGRDITSAAVRDADVLLVRSVTPVGPALLDGSGVQFVGSATIGTDHVDQAYLRRRGIAFAHAPGSNARSVVEYVLAALLHLTTKSETPLRGRTAGIVGCGNIGQRLADRLPALGVRVLRNDPPRAAAEGPAGFVGLEEVLRAADMVTTHVPLTTAGPHPTHHLFDAATLAALQPGAWLINSARGAVVDNAALDAALPHGPPARAVLDVWEEEPTPHVPLLAQVDLATPHIAGYAYDGKVRGTQMLHDALCAHLGRSPVWSKEAVLAIDAAAFTLTPPDPSLPEAAYLHALVRQMYAITTDDAALRQLTALPASAQGSHFSNLRKTYRRRRSFMRYTIAASAVPPAYRTAVAEGLGVRVV